MSDSLDFDTAVVGGGITGLYTCYKLKQLKGTKHTISLFEGTNRFGGRIETIEMGGFYRRRSAYNFESYKSYYLNSGNHDSVEQPANRTKS